MRRRDASVRPMPASPRSRIRVLVADDHRSFAESLALAIEREKTGRPGGGGPLLGGGEVTRLFRVLRHRRHQESTERQRASRLTPRQLEILQLLSDGISPSAIAEQLHMRPATLRTHVQNILT